MKMKYTVSICFLFLLACQAQENSSKHNSNKKMVSVAGLSFVAPPRPFPENPMPAVKEINANWIAVIPYAFTRPNSNELVYRYEANENQYNWWGERPEGVKESIRLAHEADINVMLKPSVYVPSGWTGDMEFKKEEDWVHWEKGYSQYILYFAQIAQENKVAMFCIGNEYKKSAIKRPEYWLDLIQKIREVYQGPLTYASNWDCYDKIPFWKALDFVGINAYFPLTDAKKPTIKQLKQAWSQPFKAIKSFQDKVKKPILFTEYGYLSVDGCTYNTWELEKRRDELTINENAQANAIQALFEVFAPQEWWHGGFIWKWYPNQFGRKSRKEKDYTPQGKLAEKVLERYHIK